MASRSQFLFCVSTSWQGSSILERGGPLALAPGTADKPGQISPLGAWPRQMFPQPLPWLALPHRPASPMRFSHCPGPFLQRLLCRGFCLWLWRDLILALISLRFDVSGSFPPLPGYSQIKPSSAWCHLSGPGRPRMKMFPSF